MSNMVVALTFLAIMIAVILLGVNIGLGMFLVGAVGIAVLRSPMAALSIMRTVPFAQSLTYNFIVIPLFTLMGELIFAGGVSSGLYNAAEKWVGRTRGGLSHATILACSFFAAISGSNIATTVTMGIVAYPEMKKYKYKDSLCAGCITAGGTLGVLIPPSTLFIIYGIVAEQSIGRLFAAGIIPGIILALCYSGAIFIWTRIDPELGPQSRKFSMKEKLASIPGVLPVVILFLLVLGSIFTGITSAAEAAAIGAFASLVIMIINGRFTVKIFVNCIMNAAKISGMTLFCIIGAYVFGNFMSVARLPQLLKAWFDAMQFQGWVIVVIMFAVYLVMGCVMDCIPMILITVPIFMPILQANGYDPIWFGVFCVLVNQIGMMTPPVGVNAYVTCGILKGVSMLTVFKGCLPFVAAASVCVLLITFFPRLCTIIPDMIYGVSR